MLNGKDNGFRTNMRFSRKKMFFGCHGSFYLVFCCSGLCIDGRMRVFFFFLFQV